MAMAAKEKTRRNTFPSHITISFTVEPRHKYFYIVGDKISPIAAAIIEKLGTYSFVGFVSNQIYIAHPERADTYETFPMDDVLVDMERRFLLNEEVELPYTFSMYLPVHLCPYIDKSGNYKADSRVYKAIYDCKVKEFKKGAWLDNKWISNTAQLEKPIEIEPHLKFHTVENYYQAMKTKDPLVRGFIAGMSALEAKKYWSKYKSDIRKDWKEIRNEVMFKGLNFKFKQQKYLHELIYSYPSPIIEFNNWADGYWGVYVRNFDGENVLGRMIMKIRARYMNTIPF